MKTQPEPEPRPSFAKVPKYACLYRYSSTNVYFAFLKKGGKTYRVSLDTTNLSTAREKLKKEQEQLKGLDPSQRSLSLEALVSRYLTMLKGASKTVDQKTRIVSRLLNSFQLGKACRVTSIKGSDLQIWMAQFKFGYSSSNRYRFTLRELFHLAIRDGAIISNPADALE